MAKIESVQARVVHVPLATATAFAAEGPFRDLEPSAQRSLPVRAAAGEIPLPRRFRTLEVDVQALRDLLGRAPAERSAGASPLELVLPYPDGTDRLFRVEESPILEPALAAKFPEIHTYVAQGIDDPTATARLSLTSLGFHAMVLSAAGTVYIDPYHKGDARYAVSYFKADAVRERPSIATSRGRTRRRRRRRSRRGNRGSRRSPCRSPCRRRPPGRSCAPTAWRSPPPANTARRSALPTRRRSAAR